MSCRRARTIPPALYASPIKLPERSEGEFSVRHVHYHAGSKLPIVGLRQGILTGQRPLTAVLQAPLVVHELAEGKGVWMTDMPEELNQIAQAIYAAQPSGDVLVGGLGLGVLAAALSSRIGVNSVTVVERSPEVIELCRAPGYTVIQDDIREFLDKHQLRFDCYMLDTWAGTGEEAWWTQVMPLRRVIRNRWGRQPRVWCWAEDIMLGQVSTALLGPGRHWHYEKLPQMDERAARGFTRDVGLPSWEKRYGQAVSRG